MYYSHSAQNLKDNFKICFKFKLQIEIKIFKNHYITDWVYKGNICGVANYLMNNEIYVSNLTFQNEIMGSHCIYSELLKQKLIQYDCVGSMQQK